MKSWITKRSEAFKIVGVWLLCLLIFCGLWLATILYFLGDARRASAIRLTASRIRIEELEARRAEKDFMLRSLTDYAFFREGRSEYLEKHGEKVLALRKQIESLGEMISPERKPEIHRLLEMVKRHHDGFRKLVSAFRQRGFKEWGLEGDLNRAFVAVAGAIERAANPAVQRAYSDLRLNESSLRFYRNIDSADRFATDLEKLRKTIIRELPNQEIGPLLEPLQRCAEAFSKLRALQERIGKTEDQGYRGDLRKAIHAIEPAIEKLLDEANRVEEKAIRALRISIFVASLIMAVLLALAILFAQTARFHTKQLVLANSRMKENQRKLLQSERLAAIGEMVTGLTHESRNVLQRTHACLDLLVQEIQDRPEAVALIGRIEEAQDQLHVLYEQVREYAAPIRIKRGSHQLNKILASAWESLALLREGTKADFVQNPNALDLLCDVDAFAIEQVFRNIFENSLAACGKTAEIKVHYAEGKIAADAALQVIVTDNGPGLDQDQMARIFDPFYTTKTRGTGLGMAIAKRLVEAHGGAMEAGSATGGGARIVVILPRKGGHDS